MSTHVSVRNGVPSPERWGSFAALRTILPTPEAEAVRVVARLRDLHLSVALAADQTPLEGVDALAASVNLWVYYCSSRSDCDAALARGSTASDFLTLQCGASIAQEPCGRAVDRDEELLETDHFPAEAGSWVVVEIWTWTETYQYSMTEAIGSARAVIDSVVVES